jgi:hypothetical protein
MQAAMKRVLKGLFRTTLPGIGECARVDMRAGDAAPYLERDMYVLLGFEPPFDLLPASAPRAELGKALHTQVGAFPQL